MSTWKEALARAMAGGTITGEELDEIIAKSGSRTAEESERLFRACPEWVAEQEAREKVWAANAVKSHAEQELLVADIRRAGYPVRESVWELVNTADSYPEAIPVLLKHLKRPYSDRLKEGIARALSVREARGVAGPSIVKAFDNAQNGDRFYRWALANALTTVAKQSDRDAIKRLIEVEVDDDVRDRLKRALKTAAKP